MQADGGCRRAGDHLPVACLQRLAVTVAAAAFTAAAAAIASAVVAAAAVAFAVAAAAVACMLQQRAMYSLQKRHAIAVQTLADMLICYAAVVSHDLRTV